MGVYYRSAAGSSCRHLPGISAGGFSVWAALAASAFRTLSSPNFCTLSSLEHEHFSGVHGHPVSVTNAITTNTIASITTNVLIPILLDPDAHLEAAEVEHPGEPVGVDATLIYHPGHVDHPLGERRSTVRDLPTTQEVDTERVPLARLHPGQQHLPQDGHVVDLRQGRAVGEDLVATAVPQVRGVDTLAATGTGRDQIALVQRAPAHRDRDDVMDGDLAGAAAALADAPDLLHYPVTQTLPLDTPI